MLKKFWKGLTNHQGKTLLFSIIIFFICSCSYWHKPFLKFMIPEDYEGMIVISWDQKNGTPVQKEGDYEVYKIPADGFLRTRMKARNMSPEDEKYFSYSAAKGIRMELEIIDPGTYVDTASITKKNQLYKLGWLSVSDKYGQYAVFFVTRNKRSKFMDNAYREDYFKTHIDSLFKAHQVKPSDKKNVLSVINTLER